MMELIFGTNLYNKKIINAPLLNKSLSFNSTVLDIIKSTIIKECQLCILMIKLKPQ